MRRPRAGSASRPPRPRSRPLPNASPPPRSVPAPSPPRSPAGDVGQARALWREKAWAGGPPVSRPAAPRVRALLDGAGPEAGREIAFIAHRKVAVTAEKAAINAAMAGCRPEYFPVVVAG